MDIGSCCTARPIYIGSDSTTKINVIGSGSSVKSMDIGFGFAARPNAIESGSADRPNAFGSSWAWLPSRTQWHFYIYNLCIFFLTQCIFSLKFVCFCILKVYLPWNNIILMHCLSVCVGVYIKFEVMLLKIIIKNLFKWFSCKKYS